MAQLWVECSTGDQKVATSSSKLAEVTVLCPN